MPHWNCAEMHCLLHAETPETIFKSALALTESLRMQYLGLVLRLPCAAPAPGIVVYNNYPKRWNQRYHEQDFQEIDPVICKHAQGPLACLWDDELFRRAPQLREQASEHGLCHGWSHTLNNTQSMIHMSVARPTGVIGRDEFYENCVFTLWLTTVLLSRLSHCHLPAHEPLPALSEREQEVAKWSASGKTAADIAIIMGLSRSTVNFHIRNLISKTNASNKTGAVAIATTLGML